MWKITKDNNEDLDFVLTCLFCQAIQLNEMKLWADLVIKTSPIDNIPNYIFDLVCIDISIGELDDIIGFIPNGQSSKYRYAIYGIAYLREVDVYDPPISKEQALATLKSNPHVLDEFKRFFPFIEVDTDCLS
ncbi:hypothetical protein [Neisseria musculi]|uniref:Uncharacterized protein n=1 Tax=Neisseria musculi TaxID=1815583 RepID=A0A7H1MCE0_9NEIS|nr:hypothetical protein [Neisseria musculi]QNT59305.1 hypothetical protein H7A79_0207 [Neisseria musculi]